MSLADLPLAPELLAALESATAERVQRETECEAAQAEVIAAESAIDNDDFEPYDRAVSVLGRAALRAKRARAVESAARQAYESARQEHGRAVFATMKTRAHPIAWYASVRPHIDRLIAIDSEVRAISAALADLTIEHGALADATRELGRELGVHSPEQTIEKLSKAVATGIVRLELQASRVARGDDYGGQTVLLLGACNYDPNIPRFNAGDDDLYLAHEQLARLRPNYDRLVAALRQKLTDDGAGGAEQTTSGAAA